MSDTGQMDIKMTFEDIYQAYYPKLVRFSREYVGSTVDAENVVQDVFIVLWEHRDGLDELRNVNAYLFRLVKNKCIDFLRHKIRVSDKHCSIQDVEEKEVQLKLYSMERFDENLLSDEVIEELIKKAIDSLPEKCREIFMLSRIEGMKYQEIADQLNLSTNTVSNQISIALKKLKVELKDYLPVLLFLIV